MTRDEFIDYYCRNSDKKREWLMKNKGHAELCHCDYEKCKGWKMVFGDDLFPDPNDWLEDEDERSSQ
jgi:hypothetical protein